MCQEFEVQQMTLVFGESMRPRQIVLHKSASGWASLVSWVYLITNELNCTRQFGLSLRSTPADLDSKLCMAYASMPQAMNEQVRGLACRGYLINFTLYYTSSKAIGAPSFLNQCTSVNYRMDTFLDCRKINVSTKLIQRVV